MSQKAFLRCGQIALSVLLLSQTISASAAPDCADKTIHCVGPGEEFNTSVEFVESAFQAAADTSKPGDTIKIRAGTYAHDIKSPATTFLKINNSGTASAPITIEPYGDGKVLIEGFGYPEGTSGPTRSNERLIEVEGDYIHIRGLELEYSTRYGLRVSGRYGLFEELEIHDCWQDNIILINAGNGDAYNVEGNIIRNVEVYRSRHEYGIRAAISSTMVAEIKNNIIEDSLSHHNGYQPDGKKVPPFAGDPAGGGNSDGICIEKGCHDEAGSESNLCGGNIIRGNIVWNNSDDGIDVSFGAGSQVLDNIAFQNGPEGNKGLKVLRAVKGGLTFMGNVAVSNVSRGYELRADSDIKVLHNLSMSHPDQEYYVGVSGSTAGSMFSNNTTVVTTKTSPETAISSGVTQASNWLAAGQGDTQLTKTTFSLANDINTVLPSGLSIRQKVASLRYQFQKPLLPTASSPLVDKGTFIPGVHCEFAFDDGSPANTSDKQSGCRRWLGAAPDIGPYEFGMELINPPMPPQLRVE